MSVYDKSILSEEDLGFLKLLGVEEDQIVKVFDQQPPEEELEKASGDRWVTHAGRHVQVKGSAGGGGGGAA